MRRAVSGANGSPDALRLSQIGGQFGTGLVAQHFRIPSSTSTAASSARTGQFYNVF